jgi:hypothetical protein
VREGKIQQCEHLFRYSMAVAINVSWEFAASDLASSNVDFDDLVEWKSLDYR